MKDIPVRPKYITRYTTLFEFYKKFFNILTVIHPFSELQPKQLDFLAALWSHNFSLLNKIKDYGIRNTYIFSNEGLEVICKQMHITLDQARNYRTRLVKAGIVIATKTSDGNKSRYILDPTHFVMPDVTENGVDVVIKLKYAPKSNRKVPLVRERRNEE